MISLFKKTMKVAVVTAGVLGVATLAAFAVAGKDRTTAVVHDLHGKVLEKIDASIDDPSAMRAQLREMEQEYPERIAQVRGDLAELQHEIRQLEREAAISERVVALADHDLSRLEEQLAAQVPGEHELVAVKAVKLDDHVYSMDRARIRLNQIRNTRVAYANRGADAKHDKLYLEKQEGRLQELLAKLEAERAEFQTQIVGLSRQIDAIARNDRLIKLLEKRNRTIEECSRYEAVSLDQITGRLDSIKTRQEAELDLLANTQQQSDYEGLARMQLATEDLEGQHDEFVERGLSDF
jgi:chromosome segregation ATPase